MSISVWFVKNNAVECQDFLDFLKLEKMDAHSMIDFMIPSLWRCGMHSSLLVAQGYGGTGVMSSKISGIKAKVCALFYNVIYVH